MGLNFDEVAEAGAYDEADEIVTVGRELSLEVAKPKFEVFRGRALEIVRDAKAVEVRDVETQGYTVALIGEAKRIIKAVEERRKAIVTRPNDYVTAVNSIAKMITGPLNEAVTVATAKEKSYNTRLELDRQEAARQAKLAADKLQAEMRREADELNKKAMEEARKVAEEESERLRKIAEEEARKRKASEDELAALKARLEKDRITALKTAEEEAAKIAVFVPDVLAPVMPKQDNVVRTATGVAAHTAKKWKGEIVDPALVPAQYCTPDQRLIDQAVKEGVRNIPGVNIFEESIRKYRT